MPGPNPTPVGNGHDAGPPNPKTVALLMLLATLATCIGVATWLG